MSNTKKKHEFTDIEIDTHLLNKDFLAYSMIELNEDNINEARIKLDEDIASLSSVITYKVLRDLDEAVSLLFNTP